MQGRWLKLPITTQSRRVIATYAGLFLLIVYLGWWTGDWWIRNEPLHIAASNVVRAFEERDIDTLWHYADLGEKQAYQLNKRKYELIFREYIWPHTIGLRSVKTTRQGHEETGIYQIANHFKLGGRTVAYDIVVFETEEGPKTNTITPGIVMVFDVKYGDRHPELTGSNRYFSMRLDGALGERRVLERLGVTGTKDSSPERPMVPWDRDIEILSNFLKRRVGRAN